VVTSVVDEGHETKYYRIIKNIIEYNFAGNKKLKTIFFYCDWFDPNHSTQENQFGVVEVKHIDHLSDCDPFILAHLVEQVYYMSYPCQNLSVWWVVYKVNPHEWLHTRGDVGYHENQVEVGEVDEVYQDDELSCSFNIDINLALESLLGDANDVTVPEERVQQLSKKKKCKIFNVLDISYYVLDISYYILCISYYVLDISYFFYFILCSLHILTCACFQQDVKKVEGCLKEAVREKE
jgi:hypothetical protein